MSGFRYPVQFLQDEINEIVPLTPIPPDSVLGNVGSSDSLPTALSTTQLTSLVNVASTGASGAITSLSGSSGDFLAGTGAFLTLPPPPPQNFVFLNSQSVTAASAIIFSSLDNTYPIYQFHFRNLSPSSNSPLYAQVSTSNGSVWRGSGQYNNTISGSDGIYLSSSNVATTAQQGLSGWMEYAPFGVLNNQSCAFGRGVYNLAGGGLGATLIGGYLFGSATLNAIRFLPSNGSNITGTVYMYGLTSS